LSLQETAADRIAEWKIAEAVAAHLKLGFAKINDITYGFDFVMTNGAEADRSPRVVLYLEAKARDGSDGRNGWGFGIGDGYRLSLHKAQAAKLATATTGLECMLAARFRCGNIYLTNFNQRDKRIIMAGREPRPGCPNDIEPHVIFPWNVWQHVAEPMPPRPKQTEDFEW
jgi:hypothetical protein